MAGVRGSFGRLGQLQGGLKRLASPAFRRDLNRQYATELMTQTQLCFQGSRDPYGAPWAPLKHRAGMPLLDTRRLANSLSAASDADRITISSGVVYAAIQNYGGTVKRSARTELRRYSVTANGTRQRISLFSRRARSVRATASYGDGQTTIPPRPCLPNEIQGLPAAYQTALENICRLMLRDLLQMGGA